MSLEAIDLLAEEKIVNMSQFLVDPEKYLGGVMRLVDDATGTARGLYFDLEAFMDLVEDIKVSSPAFIASLEESRRSGRISSETAKKELGL